MPIRLFKDKGVLRLYQPSSELDLTDKMNKFCSTFLASQENIDGIVLKNRSPSCGFKDVKIYNKKDSFSREKK
jgi:uncharacterized protein YbbK (DUF523 family)